MPSAEARSSIRGMMVQDSVEGQSRREEQHVMLDDPPRDCPCIEPDGFGNAQRAAAGYERWRSWIMRAGHWSRR